MSKGGAGPGRKRLHGEVPDEWPSIWTQIKGAPGSKDKRTCILVDGGINDVGVFNIVNPFYNPSKLRAQTKKACYENLLDVLLKLVGKYKGAEVYVAGYYQILASGARKADLARFLYTRGVCDAKALVAVNFVSKAVANSRIFWQDSDKHIQAAAGQAHKEALKTSGSVKFVNSGFKASDGLFGSRSLLFKPGQVDPQADDRIVPCWNAIRKGRSGLHCFPAATGHPNTAGVIRYVKNFKLHMK